MTKKERFFKKVNKSNASWLIKNIDSQKYYSLEQFFNDCERYVKAIKEGRVICNIESVSKSGMSRTIKFLECAKGNNRYNYLNFYSFFKSLGYSEVNRSHYFRISGCGMDMIFHTNYTNIHYMQRFGIITKKQCEHLAQQTPPII